MKEREDKMEESFSKSNDGKLLDSLMQLIIELRSRARQAKDFATADLIRDSLNEAEIQLEDRADGTDWSIK